MAFDKNKYSNQFKKNYDNVRILIPKGKKQFLKERADELGISVSKLIVRAIESTYHINMTD